MKHSSKQSSEEESGAARKKELIYGELKLDLNERKLEINGQVHVLKNKEFFLLKFLMKNPEQVFSRGQLLDFVWDRNDFCKTNTVDVHVSILRKILASMTSKNLIKTIHCAGYMLKDNGL